MSRPEVQAPPEIFYNDVEARKYTSSSRIIEIQAKLSERAVELLALPDDGVPRLLLDIGNCFFHLCPSKSLPELISQGSYFLISQGQSVKPISSPVPNEWFPTLAVFMLAIGLIVTASFFINTKYPSISPRSK